MSIFPRKLHGPEVKCGGPQMCPDCKERVERAQDLGLDNPFADWYPKEEEEKIPTLDEIIKKGTSPKE